MKSITYTAAIKTAVIGSFIAILLYLSGCDITDPTDGIKAILNTKERTTTVSVIFRDANTGEPVGFGNGLNVTTQITGPDSDKVIDLLNRPTSSFDAKNGFLSFAVQDDFPVSRDNPLRFNIVASADGYISTSVPVVLTNVSGNPIDVQMVSRSNAPSGVDGGSASNVGSTTADTGTSDNISINSQAIGRDIPVSVTVPQGTIMRDADGNALSGNVDAEIYHFSSREESALQSFPGGFSASIQNFDDFFGQLSPEEQNLIGQTEENGVFFTTGGFLSLEMRVGGTQVSTFSQPIDIEMELEDDVTDASGSPVSPGDTAPIWSYNEATGQWNFERNTTIGVNKNNRKAVSFQADHLSWWNIDWFGPRCFMGTRVNLIGNNSQLRGKLLRTDVTPNTFLGWAPSRSLPGVPNFIQFLNAPLNVPGKLELYNMADQLVGTQVLEDLCSPTDVDFQFGETTEITVTFRGVGTCVDNDDIEVRPNFPAFYRPAVGGSWLSAGSVVNGELEITLPAPGNYLFGAYYEGDWYDYELDLTDAEDGDVYEEEVELPQSVCDDL